MTNNYEQLQEFLNKCIELGWSWYRLGNPDCYFVCDWDVLITAHWKHYSYSYHELFSKDSGLMEFVKWKDNSNTYELNPGCEYERLDCDCRWPWSSFDKNTRAWYHYMTMWPMTSDMKIEYFLENALLPTTTTDDK